MDRSLDDVISERQRGRNRGDRGRRQNLAPRDGVRKTQRDEPRNLDRDWVHDRFDDEYDQDDRRPARNSRPSRPYREPEPDRSQAGAKIRVDNLHYDLSEDDLKELFTRIGPVQLVTLLYDRQDRSRGIAYVTYTNLRDAEDAIHEFNGANAKGQPISIALVPNNPRPRNPFDYAERPGRSLFDRVEGAGRRSASPDDGGRLRIRGTGGRNSGRRPTPDGIDRYVPGDDSRRSSPRRYARGGGRGGSSGAGRLGPGQRRERQRSSRRDDEGHTMVKGRPRKTEEELDAEMNDYWGKADASNDVQDTSTVQNGGGSGAKAEDDVDMIE